MARPRTRPDPNVAAPLSESSPQRRLWAAYRAKGLDRAEYARQLGVAYQTVDRWDQEKSMPELDVFRKACEIVGYTPNQILGWAEPVPSVLAPDDELAPDELDAFATTVNAYAEAIKPTFVAVYRIERAAGTDRETARSKAHEAAIAVHQMTTKKRAVADAIAAGGKPASEFATSRDKR
jgi:transcriptional regulator with XRE-family HTH domain